MFRGAKTRLPPKKGYSFFDYLRLLLIKSSSYGNLKGVDSKGNFKVFTNVSDTISDFSHNFQNNNKIKKGHFYSHACLYKGDLNARKSNSF